MLDLNELEQLVAFAECGRLSKAAENLHISQPTITRTMQHLEEEFGVSLFERSKNRISLNETGKRAAECAVVLLKNADQALMDVRAFDKSLHTITVSSCAPAPLWSLLPALSQQFPGQTISSSIHGNADVFLDLKSGNCTLALLPYAPADGSFCCLPFIKENLYACLTQTHPLSKLSEVSFEELNGYNFLLAQHLGFWYDLCIEKMPASLFHIQNSNAAMEELIRTSSLPCFVTNLSMERRKTIMERKIIPITDPEANVTYYMVFDANRLDLKKALADICS